MVITDETLRIELAHTKERAISLEAEVAATNKAWNIKQEQLEEARAECERVKAELDDLRRELSGNDAAHRLALAKLERFRPLIEAAQGVDKAILLSYLDNPIGLPSMSRELRAIIAAIPEEKA